MPEASWVKLTQQLKGLLKRLRGAKIFSILDLNSGYQQILNSGFWEAEAKSRPMTDFMDLSITYDIINEFKNINKGQTTCLIIFTVNIKKVNICGLPTQNL